MIIKNYDALPDGAKFVREEVFMKEQGFKNEFDDTDDIAIHFVVYDNDRPIATCRIFDSDTEDTVIFGRLAVVKSSRGHNTGAKLLGNAENYAKSIGKKYMILHAQCRVKSFYEKLGYIGYGDIEDDEGCPHIWMKKELL